MKSFTLDGTKAWVRSEQFRLVALIVIAVLVLCVTFQAGVAIGFHRAAFSYNLDQNYGRTFGRTTDRFMLPGAGTPSSHGAFGTIISVSDSTITISANNHPEQQVSFDASTDTRDKNTKVDPATLTVGTSVIVFGEPTESGVIQARLIRIMPQGTGMPSPSALRN